MKARLWGVRGHDTLPSSWYNNIRLSVPAAHPGTTVSHFQYQISWYNDTPHSVPHTHPVPYSVPHITAAHATLVQLQYLVLECNFKPLPPRDRLSVALEHRVSTLDSQRVRPAA
eukprot:963403-Rhodomonas_salina.1